MVAHILAVKNDVSKFEITRMYLGCLKHVLKTMAVEVNLSLSRVATVICNIEE